MHDSSCLIIAYRLHYLVTGVAPLLKAVEGGLEAHSGIEIKSMGE